MAEKIGTVTDQDELADALTSLFSNISAMVQGELQGSSNMLELLEKMNLKVAEEYTSFSALTAGLRDSVEQVNKKNSHFDGYAQQIDAIDDQVKEFEVVISMLDRYVSLLESKVRSAYSPSQLPRAET